MYYYNCINVFTCTWMMCVYVVITIALVNLICDVISSLTAFGIRFAVIKVEIIKHYVALWLTKVMVHMCDFRDISR